jgi:hypothetical protein
MIEPVQDLLPGPVTLLSEADATFPGMAIVAEPIDLVLLARLLMVMTYVVVSPAVTLVGEIVALYARTSALMPASSTSGSSGALATAVDASSRPQQSTRSSTPSRLLRPIRCERALPG